MCSLDFHDFRELIQSFSQQCSNAVTTSQMSLSAMTGGKYSSSSTLGNDQLAAHASACVEEVVESSSCLSSDKNKNPSSILPRLHASMAHNRMETRSCSSVRSVQSIWSCFGRTNFSFVCLTLSTNFTFFIFGF